MMTIRRLLIFGSWFLVIAGVAMVGCTEDDDGTTGGYGPVDELDTSVSDRWQEDVGDAVGDEDQEETSQCVSGTSLGNVEPGDQGSETISLTTADAEQVHCGSPGSDAELRVATVEFTSEQPVDVSFSYVGDLSGVDEITTRSFDDGCDDETSACVVGNDSQRAYGGPGEHAVTIEMVGTARSVMLEYEVESAVCGPSGDIGCDDGEYRVCHRGERIDGYDCPLQTCEDDGACAGNSCWQAMDVEPGTPDEPMVVEGHRRGYHHTAVFDGVTGCESEDTHVDDTSAEMFFRLDEIPADHDLVVESRGQGRYGYFVVSGCEPDRCLHVQTDDVVEHDDHQEVFNRLRWAPESNGEEVIVAVRPSDSFERSFEFWIYLERR